MKYLFLLTTLSLSLYGQSAGTVTHQVLGVPAYYCADAGATDTYACSITPSLDAYREGTHYTFKANTANTGAATVNFNGVGAVAIKTAAGADLATGDIRAGQMVDVVYTATAVMQMQSTPGNAAPIELRPSGGDDTAVVQAYITAGTSIKLSPGTWSISGLTATAAANVSAYGAVINRLSSTNAPFVALAAGSIWRGGTFDGKKGTITQQSGDIGIYATDGTLIEDVTIHDCYRQGIYVQNDGADRTTLRHITSYDNGITPGAFGTGDGIVCNNCMRTVIQDVYTYGNARTGVVASTYPVDATTSKYTLLDGVVSTGNGYNDINWESLSFAHITNVHKAGIISFSSSAHVTVDNVLEATQIYSALGDFPTVKNVHLIGNSEALYLTGVSPVVDAVSITPAGSPSGNMVYVVNSSFNGSVTNVTITASVNGIQTSAYNLTGNNVTSSNVPIVHHLSGGTANFGTLVSVRNGYRVLAGTDIPTTGYWQRGDQVDYVTGAFTSSAWAWRCITSGTPGTWARVNMVKTDGAYNPGSVAFAALPASPTEGDMIYCSACTVSAGACATGAGKATAVYDGAAWRCTVVP